METNKGGKMRYIEDEFGEPMKRRSYNMRDESDYYDAMEMKARTRINRFGQEEIIPEDE